MGVAIRKVHDLCWACHGKNFLELQFVRFMIFTGPATEKIVGFQSVRFVIVTALATEKKNMDFPVHKGLPWK